MNEIICAALPHTRHGEWKTERAKQRMLFYLSELKSLGMSKADAQCMISDLYWDCYAELLANRIAKPI